MQAVVIILMIITLLTLFGGLYVMVRGGKVNAKYSNKLMVARVWFQAITIAVLLIIVFIVQK